MRGRTRAVLLAAVLSSGLLPEAAKADEAHDLAARLVATTGATRDFEETFTLVRGALIRQVAGSSAKSEAEVARIIDDLIMPSLRGAIPAMQRLAVDVYARNYSVADLRGLQAFYATPLGRELVAKGPLVAAEIATAVPTIIRNQLASTIRAHADELRKRGVSL